MGEGKDAKEHDKGHRERLRARYRLSGEAALMDYELLELLLTFAIPRRDTKLLAKKLLERFGTLARIFEAEPQALEEIDGIGPQAGTLLSLPYSFKANRLLWHVKPRPSAAPPFAFGWKNSPISISLLTYQEMLIY